MSDTARIRVVVHAVYEHDARFSDYETQDPVEIARMDLQSAEEDVFMFLYAEDVQWTITAEPVVAAADKDQRP